jgi:hypothetical protein
MAAPRTLEQRKVDTLSLLSAPAADAWVATASPDGIAHMVPLSIAWTDDRILLVTEARSLTVRNLNTSKLARLGVGGTRDVVLIVAELVGDYALGEASAQLVGAYVSQSDWDPTASPDADAYRLLELRPVQIQAWREIDEISDRTLMRNGEWNQAAK